MAEVSGQWAQHHHPQQELHQDNRPLLLGIGIDGITGMCAIHKEVLTAMEPQLTHRLIIQARQRGYVVARIDEYNTSRNCCRCMMTRDIGRPLEYHRRPPTRNQHADPSTLDPLGRVQVIRVQYCDDWHMHLYGDGNAAHKLATVGTSILEHGRRHETFIRPFSSIASRRKCSY